MDSLYQKYLGIFQNCDNWFRFSYRKNADITNYKFNELFQGNNANNFIRNIFFQEGMMKIINKINFPANRDYHTVSAFLLGILLKNELTLSMKKLPRICGDYNKSFIYFWSMVCLSHDITYYIENNSEKYIDKSKTIEDFIVYFNLKFNLLDDSKYSNLFEKYYKFRTNYSRIDHGITCGLILYNLLMEQYTEHLEMKKQNPDCIFVTEDHWKYSKEFKKHALKIAETIARHNLWVANDNNVQEYKNFELLELIPGTESFSKVSYNEDDSLLFLLGLVDTLDPIKCFAQSENECYNVLKDINIKFKNKNKEIHIQSSKYLFEDIMSRWRELSSWMSLDVECDVENHVIKIKFDYESIENEKIAA